LKCALLLVKSHEQTHYITVVNVGSDIRGLLREYPQKQAIT